MFAITDAKKEDYWSVLSAERRPRGLTAARMNKLKVLLWHDAGFWDDIVARHGGLALTATALRDSAPENYQHMLGNFHGMLAQTAWERWRVG